MCVAYVRIQAQSLPLSTALSILGSWEAEWWLWWVDLLKSVMWLITQVCIDEVQSTLIHARAVSTSAMSGKRQHDCIPFHTQEQ